MAEKDLKNVNDAANGAENKETEIVEAVSSKQKYIMWGMVAIAAVAVIVLVYVFAIRQPGIKAANEAIGQPDYNMLVGNDSIALAQYTQVANTYGYDAGNRAALMAAIMNYQKGDYSQALEMVKKYDAQDALVGAAAASLEGDCLVNLEQYEQAVKAFDKAISISDNNPEYTPLFMMKKATVQRELKDYAGELKTLEAVKAYPEYWSKNRIDIEKYIARAEREVELAK